MKKLNNKIIPVIYYDIIKDKKVILKENNGKSGVYRWVNNINKKKSYKGSAIIWHVDFIFIFQRPQ